MTVPILGRAPVAARAIAPRSVLLAGDAPEAAILRRNLAGFPACAEAPGAGRALTDAIAAAPTADLALLACTPEDAPASLAALGARGIRVAAIFGRCPDLGAAARRAGVRVLGPYTFGVAAPHAGLDATLSHIPIPRGDLALVTQSTSLARAVVDWARPNGVGFSHVVGIGAGADLGFAPVLDHLSRDGATKLILLDIRRLGDARAFLSAARAAARLRPVLAIRPGGRARDASGREHGVFEAALGRAGIALVSDLEDVFAAAETITRAKPAEAGTLAIVTNALGPGRLAADAATRAGIPLYDFAPELETALAALTGTALADGLVLVRATSSVAVADLAAALGGAPALGGVLVILGPEPEGEAAIAAVIAAAAVARLPLVACVMGETTGAPHRRRLADAGVPVFATPGQAVRAFAQLLRQRAARRAARELPSSRVLAVAPDHAAAAAEIAAAREAGATALAPDAAGRFLAAYGIRMGGTAATLRLDAFDDPVFGPALTLEGGTRPAYGLPPLNLALAAAFLRRAGVPRAAQDTLADLLVRVGQLLVDEPHLAALTLHIDAVHGRVPHASLSLRPPGDVARLAIAPYPAQLCTRWPEPTPTFTLRPIRPEDARAHIALLRRIPREDLRTRFFAPLRDLPDEQMIRFTSIDYDREMAFIAVRDADEATLGVARLVREDEMQGEFAILVAPEAKGTGLAAVLMTQLLGWARHVGVRRVVGTILAENTPMLRFARRMGFATAPSPDDPDLVDARLDLAAAP